MEDHGYISDAKTSNGKRRRTLTRTACTRCRQRRVKCSGDVPCKRCQEIDESGSCVLPAPTARATSSRIVELERQVQVLQATLEAVRTHEGSPIMASTSRSNLSNHEDVKPARALFLSRDGSSRVPPARRQFAADAWSDEENIELEDAIPEVRPSDSLFDSHPATGITLLGPARTRQVLQLYTEQTQPIHPVLAWSTFFEDYEKYEALLPFVPDKVWLATLQVVIAHAIQTTSPETDVEVSPATFFAESLQILGLPVMLGATSIALVQCLLLMTAFAQTLNEPDLSISLLGLAIQKCKALGFTSRSPLNTRNRLARLCWSGCISRDFYVSVALGKAPFLNEFDCRADLLPLSQEEDALLRQPNAQPHPLAFFNEGIKLHHVVFCALHRVYPSVGSENFDVRLLQELDERLLTWHEQLPAFLQPDQPLIVSKEASYIQVRFWYSRILVHRSALCHLFSPQGPTSAKGLSLEVLLLCAKTAAEAGIQLVDRLCPIMAETTTAWWINLIALYTACLTLVMAAKFDSKNAVATRISPERTATALDAALDALNRFSMMAGTRLPAASQTARYCADDIRRLRRKVATLSVPDASHNTMTNAVATSTQPESWYFAGYDWSSLFDHNSNAPRDEHYEAPGLEASNFDFAHLLVNPGMPSFNQGQDDLSNWLGLQ